MDPDRLNKWLSLVANFGVVAGIFFLAVEIRQNQITLEQNQTLMKLEYELQVADSQLALADSAGEFRSLIAGDKELAQIWVDGNSGRELAPVDQSRYNQLCGMRIWSRASMWQRNLVLDQVDLAQAEEKVTRRLIDNQPGFRKCWESQVELLRLWSFGGLVDGVASAEPSAAQPL